MSYIVTLTNGTVLTTIADATIDDSSSLILIGRNYPGYGQYIAADMIHMLENFSNTTSPPSPLTGQLWYNSTTGILNIYNGSSWAAVSLASNAPVGGDLTGTLPNPTIKTSVNLTGVPTVPTAAPGTNTTQIASTAFVEIVANQSVGGDLVGTLPNPTIKTSVNLIGVPTAPTATAGTSSTQIATTAFVAAASLLILTAPLNLYVSTTGSDANPGSINSPFLTLQRAWNYIVSNVNANGFGITINVANGTYTAGITASGMPIGVNASNSISFIGNIGTPSNVLISTTTGPCFSAMNNATLVVNGFRLAASGTATDFTNPGYGLSTVLGGSIYFNNLVFGPCTNAHISSSSGGYISVSQAGANYTINGGASEHIVAAGGNCAIVDGTCTLVGSPTFLYFVYSSNCSTVDIYNMTFPGSGSVGQKFIALLNGVIVTSGAGSSYLPGSVAGTTQTGGQYV